ncbi:MAG TPA: hypothetical protein V6D19_12695 [Stenomitos sp.]
MVSIVVSFNLALACLCLSIAWQLIRLRHCLQQLNRRLSRAEAKCDRILHAAPYYILLGQSGTQQFHRWLTSLPLVRQQAVRLVVLLRVLAQVSAFSGTRLLSKSRTAPFHDLQRE